MLDCTIIYIVLFIEHNGDVSLERVEISLEKEKLLLSPWVQGALVSGVALSPMLHYKYFMLPNHFRNYPAFDGCSQGIRILIKISGVMTFCRTVKVS